MMQCPKCGRKYPTGTKFCEIHGERLIEVPASPRGGAAVSTTGFGGIHWAAIDWPFVRRWAMYNVGALLVFYVALGIVGSMLYRVILNAATDYATGMLGGLLGGLGGYGSNSNQGGAGGMIALAWLVGLGLIALYGFLVGWAQNTMLRGRFPGLNWITVSVAGAFVAAFVLYLFIRIGMDDPFLILLGLGAGFSAAQWYALRNHVTDAWIWIAGNAAAGLVLWIFLPLLQSMIGSTGLGGALDMIGGNFSGLILTLLIPTVLFGAIVTGVTGISMNYVFQKQ